MARARGAGAGTGIAEPPAAPHESRKTADQRHRRAHAAPQVERVVRAGHWIVDPGIAKQSQDWIYAGPAEKRRSPGRARPMWPALAVAALAALLLAIGGAAALAGLSGSDQALPAAATGPLAAGALYGVVAIVLLVRALRQRRSARLALDGDTGRQAWEGEIETAAPADWPDRPLVVAIGDGVSSALRSAEIARLATQTAWERTFHHLHALGDADGAAGGPEEAPWLVSPREWPASGPERDRLLVAALRAAFADANRAVIEAGQAHRRQDPGETRRTATTLTLLLVDGRRYFVAHVGDCSVYHVDGATGEIAARQEEHNKAAEHARAEPARYAERYAEARTRGLHNTLTRWLGMGPDWSALGAQLDETPGVLADGDCLVLCSDGVDKHVAQRTVSLAARALAPDTTARRLVALANEAGGSDHIAVAVLRAGPAGAAAAAPAAWWPLRREEALLAWQRSRTAIAALAAVGLVTLLATPALTAALTSAGASPAARTGAAITPAATWTPVAGATPVTVATQCQALRWCADATQRYNAAAGAPAEAQQAAERARQAAAAAAQAAGAGQARRSPGVADARVAAERAQRAHTSAATAAERAAEQTEAARALLPQAGSTDPVAGPDAAAQVAAHAEAALAALAEAQTEAQAAERARADAERAAARLPDPTATVPLPTRAPPTLAPRTEVQPTPRTAETGDQPAPGGQTADAPAATAPATRSAPTSVPATVPASAPTSVPATATAARPIVASIATSIAATATRQTGGGNGNAPGGNGNRGRQDND